MFHLLLLVYVMILDNIYFWKIYKEDDIKKINYAGRQLSWAGAFRLDRLKQTGTWTKNNTPSMFYIVGLKRVTTLRLNSKFLFP